ncbi:MAG: ABC transporter ATP-binding protein [Brevinema sp.]
MIKIEELSRSYQIDNELFFAIKDISATFSLNKISVILGRSGAGKTTLLRMIAGIEKPCSGQVIRPEHLAINMVFQEHRLMPWLNIEQNICFWNEKKQDCSEILEKTGLKPFKTLLPYQISGGMAQKTALARALFAQPNLILMDEPFASLDYFSRRDLQKLVINLQRDQQIGIIFITHNVDEAVLLGDELFILENGHLKSHFSNPAPVNERENSVYADNLKKEILSLVEN